jgi:hypothetical protein
LRVEENALDLFGTALAIAVVVVGLPLLWVLYVEFGGHLIGDVIERPPWSRTVRLIQLALFPVAVYLVWDLNFRQFAYGLTAIIGVLWAFMWARALLRGETWVMYRSSRFNIERAGPIVLTGLAVGYMSSAINPWF